MNSRRLLLYTAGLAILAFALGSLPRGSPGGSLLFQSTWLLYLIYLGPVVVLSSMIALIVLVAMNWRAIGGAIGYGMIRRRTTRKRRSRYSFFISLILWAMAIVVLAGRRGTILNLTGSNSTIIADITNQGGGTPNPFVGGLLFSAISSFVQSEWFSIVFLGLLFVGGLVIVESVRVSLKETSESSMQEIQSRQVEGLQASQDAMRLVDDKTADARTRIIACFQHLITVVSRLGAPVSSDQTARELEKAIRSTFLLKGSATSDLTQLFEEARYSLHDITDENADHAGQYLESIADELKIQLNA